jgi:hypothetical protein
MQPGPGDYDVSNSLKKSYILQTINNSALPTQIKISRKSSGEPLPIRVNPKRSQKNIYFPEYKKEFYNLEGPGPGRYQYEKFVKSINSKGVKFPKADRNLNRTDLQSDTPLTYLEGESSMVLLQK